MKNAVKGLGFMLGAALLALFGFDAAVLGMAAVLAGRLPGTLCPVSAIKSGTLLRPAWDVPRC